MHKIINSLKPGEVFVFGSNIHGQHAGGAAKDAYEKLGAEWGVGEGLTGKCYALDMMSIIPLERLPCTLPIG